MSVMCGAYLCLPYICTNSQKNTPHMRCRRKRSCSRRRSCAGPSKRAACWFRGHHFFLVSYWLRSSPANLAGSYRVEVRVNGNYAWNLNAQGQPVAQPADVAGDRQLTIWSHPVGFIKAGLEATNAAVTDRYFGRQNLTVKVVAFTIKVCDGPQPQCTRRITGEFNNDNMLERVITWVPDPVMGDKMVENRWSDYRDVGGGVKMPFHLHAHTGDHPLIPGGHNSLDLRFSDIKVNVADAAQAVPDSVRNAPAPQQRVVATQLAPGVVLLGGGSHNSVAVEFKDFVTVIEGPLNNQRTNAVVAEVKKTFPNKPIRYLVNQPVPPARMQRSQRSMVAARPRAVWLRQPQHRPM
jgi:hypothetical protein